ncbi:MAG: hypothetical protein V4754_10535 [Pseudomonadota bacterium]
MQSEARRLTAPLYEGIFAACQRGLSMDGARHVVAMAPTSYALDGRGFNLISCGTEYTFWLGVNGPHLFFIAYVRGVRQAEAPALFASCFGGAPDVSWQPNYEPLDNGVSIWASCLADRARLVAKPAHPGLEPLLTAAGQAWVAEVARMVQAWIYTCDSQRIRCLDLEAVC